jgi:hypothetical protein
MKKRTKIFLLIAPIALIVLLLILSLLIINDTRTKIRELFHMNKALQEEGYYMAEFEFKLLGLGYLINKGNYCQALSGIDKLHTQYQTREGLIKMPSFQTKEEELEFYLNLQNPKTGAFMDDSYPLNSYHGPTENVIQHLQVLANETNQPLKLKYRLSYLDQINTTEKLIATLEDWSHTTWIASKLPQTSFHNVRDLLSLARDEEHYGNAGVELLIQKHNLYDFTDEWRHSFLEWMYNFQDPETGLWGPKSKSGKLLKRDLSNTASIMKAFVDKKGNNIHEEFPLKYREELFESILNELEAMPIPAKNELDEWHEWGLKTIKGVRILPRYLWEGGTKVQKQRAIERIENFMKVRFEKNYISEQGMFTYYPNGEKATMDGADGFLIYGEVGAYSNRKQIRLFGSPEENIKDLGFYKISTFIQEHLEVITNFENINSLRFYKTNPNYNNLVSEASIVSYPRETIILDIIDLAVNMKRWINRTNISMGNWISKEEISNELDLIVINEDISIYKEIPLKVANKMLQTNGQLVIIGFDTMQVPRYKAVFNLE